MPRVFYDNFESYAVGDIPSTPYGRDGQLAPQVVTTAQASEFDPESGSKMCELNWQSGGSPNRTGMKYDFPADWGGSDTLFVRIRYRCHTDMPTGMEGIHLFRWRQSTNVDEMYFGGNTGVMSHQINMNNANVESFTFPYADFRNPAAWHTYEGYAKFSATTACRGWLDGSALANQSGLTFPNKFASMFFTSNWSGLGTPPDASNHIYVDYWELFADVAWGLGFDEATTGLMSDASIQVAVAGSAAMFLS